MSESMQELRYFLPHASDRIKRNGPEVVTPNRPFHNGPLVKKGHVMAIANSTGTHSATQLNRSGSGPKHKHELYRTWRHMISRCADPESVDWHNYGGRGIFVCDRWGKSFDAFCIDMGPRPTPRHTIDRIDNAGNYEPGNVRWATRKEQNRNKRNNVRSESGELVREIAEKAGVIDPIYAVQRLRLGMTVGDAVSKPLRFDTYQTVVSCETIPGRFAGTVVLRLTLACGCIVNRQARSSRGMPRVAKCKKHVEVQR